MNEVDNLLNKPFSSSTLEEKLEMIRLGPHQPRDMQVSQRNGKINRSFVSTWFDKIMWLTVSEERKSFFCYFCLLFGGESSWTCSGIVDLKHISERIRTHESTMKHINNAVNYKTFGKANVILMVDSGYRESVSRHNELVDKNRHVLSRIIDCIKFCGIHELPLHRQDETTESNNRGIFLDLVKLTATLDNNLDDGMKNSKVAKNTSKTFQNEILDCMYYVYIEEIKSEIDQVNFVSVQADEVTDVSCRSQFVIILRYLKDSQPLERFITFVDVDDRTSSGLTKIIVETLSQFNLNDKLIAQAYDGAAEMCGFRDGVQIQMKETYPLVHYVHCYAHQLNLVLKNACSSIKPIKLFFSSLIGIGAFFNSPKRNGCLRKINKTAVPKVWETRWNFNSNIVNTVKENQNDLIKCFEMIQQEEEWDDKSIWEATGFLNCLRSDEFNFFLSFFYLVFKHVDILYNVLQSKNSTNFLAAKAFQNFETEIDRILETIKDITVDDEMQIPEKRLKRELNTMINDAHETCAKEACIIIKDEMKNRFGNYEIFNSFAIVNPAKFNIFKKKFPTEHLDVIKINYPMLRIEKLKSELLVIYTHHLFNNFSSTNELCKFIFDSDLKETFSEVLKFLEIVLVTPVSTADAKMSFSSLKRIRNLKPIRNTISQDCLNALAVLSVQKDVIQQIPFFNYEVIDKFVSMKEGRAEYLYK